MEARKATVLGVKAFKLEAWWWGCAIGPWCVFRMVWLQVRSRDFVSFPGLSSMGGQAVPDNGGVRSKPGCCGYVVMVVF